jgi:molybdopterin-guanine dinucleotide biosynthesis protein
VQPGAVIWFDLVLVEGFRKSRIVSPVMSGYMTDAVKMIDSITRIQTTAPVKQPSPQRASLKALNIKSRVAHQP